MFIRRSPSPNVDYNFLKPFLLLLVLQVFLLLLIGTPLWLLTIWLWNIYDYDYIVTKMVMSFIIVVVPPLTVLCYIKERKKEIGKKSWNDKIWVLIDVVRHWSSSWSHPGLVLWNMRMWLMSLWKLSTNLMVSQLLPWPYLATSLFLVEGHQKDLKFSLRKKLKEGDHRWGWNDQK